jgi:hypothetical protein
VAQIPRLTADVLGSRPEHGALDRHPAVGCIVVTRRQKTLDGESEQHDALVLPVKVPARHLLGRVESRNRADLEPDVLQLGPGSAEELDGRADREVEPVETTIERGQRWTHDLAAT